MILRKIVRLFFFSASFSEGKRLARGVRATRLTGLPDLRTGQKGRGTA